MKTILETYRTISLEEMKKVKLMNRTDTKFVTTESQLRRLLALAREDYFAQAIDGETVMPYYTRYYDTEDCQMYMRHLHGKLTRKKIRVRRYVSSGLEFLEVKRKNNKGRTDKKRMETASLTPEAREDFISRKSGYDWAELEPMIENNFRRLTLVNQDMTERLTIDTGLRFHNIRTGEDMSLDGLVIIELKRDGRATSPIAEMLRQLRIMPSGFSKYCMGMAMTDRTLPKNRFKPRLRRIAKLISNWQLTDD